MFNYQPPLPQLSSKVFITDGGLETTLIFREGINLPEFAAFDLLKSQAGYQALHTYFRTYAALAQKYGVGLILESATWRANTDWGKKLGYSRYGLEKANHQAIELLAAIRKEYETEQSPMVISGCIGPRGDGYTPTQAMTVEQAADYHYAQIKTFCGADADLVAAITMNYVEEAIGIAKAAQALEIPVVISFTVETDGNLPTGQSLKSAIAQVDQATGHYPAYYMINCAHPTHFAGVLTEDEPWLERIRGVRANASTKSHAELDAAEALDDGDPIELGRQYRVLKRKLKNLNVIGGCCGTDHRHIEAICQAYLPVLWTHFSSSLPISA